MNRVLIVTYALPPVGGAGVQRTAKFIKYLKFFGWNPVVVTVKNPSVPLYDATQTLDIPINTKIYRSRTFEPAYNVKRSFSGKEVSNRLGNTKQRVASLLKSILMIPDPQIFWWPGLIPCLWKAVRKEKVDCLFVSAPPFSSLVPVVFLGRALRKPVIVDFRDDWRFYRLHMENTVKNQFAKTVDRILERYVVLNCSAFTAATASYVKNISKRNLSHNSKKGYVITNGYDKDDFSFSDQRIKKRTNGQKTHFLYSGTVWRATSLISFIKAVRVLLCDHPELKEKLHITILGRIVDNELVHFENSNLKNIVELKGYVPHDKAIEQLFSADVLIISLTDIDGAKEIIPAKTFEYMATGKRILAIVPEGETSLLLKKECENASVFHPDKVDLIAEHLFRVLTGQKSLLQEKEMDVSKYERKHLTGKLVDVFSLVTEPR